MQFMPGTWATYGIDGDGDRRADITDPADAILTAARYLKANGAPLRLRAAIHAYNHSVLASRSWLLVESFGR
jgi:membrane-bound lytic murein transglycosylase B